MSKRNVVRREERVEPTPETLAKRTFPVWQFYPPELVNAAKEIERAIDLIAGHLKMRASDFYWMDKAKERDDLTPGQTALLYRYRAWCTAMRQERAHIGYIIEILAMDQPVRFEGLLRHALVLYDRVNYRQRLRRVK